MTTQQQATQGLFLSPGNEKSTQVPYNTIKLHLKKNPMMKKAKQKKLQLGLPILAHFQKIPRSLNRRKY